MGAFNIPPHVRGSIDSSSSGCSGYQVSFDDGSSGPFVLPPDALGMRPPPLDRLPRARWTDRLEETMRASALDMSIFRPLIEGNHWDLSGTNVRPDQMWSAAEKAKMRAWIKMLHEDGMALVTGMPAEPG